MDERKMDRDVLENRGLLLVMIMVWMVELVDVWFSLVRNFLMSCWDKVFCFWGWLKVIMWILLIGVEVLIRFGLVMVVK